MPGKNGKATEKQLEALRKGREKMCANMSHKKSDDSVPPKKSSSRAAPGVSESNIVEGKRTRRAKRPRDE